MSRINTHLILLTGAVLTLFAACTQNDVFQGTIGDGVLTARIEGAVTKTSYDSIEGKFAWTEGDEIALHYTTGGYTTYAVNPTDGSVNAAATATNYRNYYAIYPATAAVADNYGNPTLQVTLPNSYDITDIVAGNQTADFSPVPMVAVNDANNSFLDFYHAGGLLRINCQGVPVGTKTIKVTMDKDITGTYTVSDLETYETSAPSPTITTNGTSSNNIVVFTISDEGLANLTDLVLNLPIPCGTYASVMVEAYGDDETNSLFARTFERKPLTFARHHGKKLDLREANFVFYMSDLSSVTSSPAGMVGSIASDFYSFKTDGINEVPVPFTIEFSEDDGQTWTTSAPDWLTLDPGIDYNGNLDSNPQSLGLSIQVQNNSIPDAHHEVLAARPAKTDFDLSTYNVATGATVATSTANCYVISAPGTYKFPLVYGNGLKDGAYNDGGYHRQNYTDTRPEYLDYFLDHLNEEIQQPYIAVQLAGKVPAITELSAKVLWTDAPGLVTNPQLVGEGENAYITFDVPQENITQGNAAIALYANGDIAWSWHIWVTEEDLASVKPVGSYYFAPVALGWVDYRSEKYISRTCQVRVIQDASESISVNTIIQNGETATFKGNNLYYQHGRKDPIRASNGLGASTPIAVSQRRTYYYPSGEDYTFTYLNESVVREIGQTIREPLTFTLYVSAKYNLWNNNSKTIYDPSPVGFKVPPQAALDIISSNSTAIEETSENTYGRQYVEGNDALRLFASGVGFWWNNTGGPAAQGPIRVGVDGAFWAIRVTDYSTIRFLADHYVFQGTGSPSWGGGWAQYQRANGFSVISVKDE